MPSLPTSDPARRWAGNVRLLGLAEAAAAIGIVLLPLPVSSTLWLLIVAVLSVYLRKERWRDLGVRLPQPWQYAILLGAFVGAAYWPIETYGLEPLLAKLLGSSVDLSAFAKLEGNLSMLIVLLVLAWTLAAVLEEVVYRGYLRHRCESLFQPHHARLAGAVVASVIFGIAHAYQGPNGVVQAIIFALAMTSLMGRHRYSLACPVVAHGTYDSIGLVALYFGVH